jgi:hypothetical protein
MLLRPIHCAGALVLLAAILSNAGCTAPTARDAWQTTFGSCVESDVLKTAVYLGPSNPVGPGSIWRRTADGSLNLRWTLEDLALTVNEVVAEGQPVTCDHESATTLEVSPEVFLQSALLPTDPRLQTALKSSTRTDVGIEYYRVNSLKEGPFEAALRSLPHASDVANEFKYNDRYVLVAGVEVSGLTMDLHFTASDATSLKALIPVNQPVDFKVGVALELRWINDTTVRMTSKGPFYVAGKFARLDSERVLGVSTTAPLWTSVDIEPKDLGIERGRY